MNERHRAGLRIVIAAGARIDFAKGTLSLRRAGADLASERIAVEGGASVRLRVEVDPAAGSIRAEARGATVEAQLPERWDAITAAGYGLSNTRSVFSEVE